MKNLDEFWETPVGLAAADIAHAICKHRNLSENELAVAIRGGVMLSTPFGQDGIARERRVLNRAAARARIKLKALEKGAS